MNELPACKYRRLTRHLDFLQLHCFLKRADCTREDCIVCSLIDTDLTTARLSNVSFGSLLNWVIESTPKEPARLQALRTSYPSPQSGTARQYTVEVDGSIIYKRAEDEWEPPRDMKGFQRDPKDSWRFISLWPKCLQRQSSGKTLRESGCTQITMTCVNPDAVLNSKEVTYQQCRQCSLKLKGA